METTNPFKQISEASITIYKCFVGSHLNYGYIIYDQALTVLFTKKKESLQQNPALAVTNAIIGMSREKNHQGLHLEFLQQRS